MSAAKHVKERGIASLSEVAAKVKTSTQTLNNWYHNKPELFQTVVDGYLYSQLESEVDIEPKLKKRLKRLTGQLSAQIGKL